MSKAFCNHTSTGCSQTHYGNVQPCGVFPAPAVGRQIEGLVQKHPISTRVFVLSFISRLLHKRVVVVWVLGEQCGLQKSRRLQLKYS